MSYDYNSGGQTIIGNKLFIIPSFKSREQVNGNTIQIQMIHTYLMKNIGKVYLQQL